MLVLGVSGPNGAELMIYGSHSRVIVTHIAVASANEQIPWQHPILLGNSFEESLIAISVGDTVRLFQPFTGRQVGEIGVQPLGPHLEIYERCEGSLGVLSTKGFASISGVYAPETALAIDAEILLFTKHQERTEIVFNDTEFDASPFEGQSSQLPGEASKNPFQRTTGNCENSGLQLPTDQRFSPPHASRNESFSGSDVSDLVHAAVEKSQQNAQVESQDYIVFQNDALLAPIFGFKIDSEPELYCYNEQEQKATSPALQCLLESTSDDSAQEDAQAEEQRQSDAESGKTPAELLLKLVKTTKKPLDLLTQPDQLPTTSGADSEKTVSDSQNEQGLLIDLSKHAPQFEEAEAMDDVGQAPALSGSVDPNIHDASIPTQSETQSEVTRDDFPRLMKRENPRSKLREEETEIVSAEPQPDFASSKTIVSLSQTVQVVELQLRQTLDAAEASPIEAIQANNDQKDALRLQLRLLQNTIDRINLFYGFDDALTTKVDELTRMMGRTLNSEEFNVRLPKNPLQSSEEQLPRLNDFI